MLGEILYLIVSIQLTVLFSDLKFFILSYSGGVLTSTDIRTYQSLRFIPEYVDVIMALEVAINFINMNVG